MTPNHLNGVFNPAQARAIEKYFAASLATVLASYEVGPIEAPKAAPKQAEKKEAPSKE